MIAITTVIEIVIVIIVNLFVLNKTRALSTSLSLEQYLFFREPY